MTRSRRGRPPHPDVLKESMKIDSDLKLGPVGQISREVRNVSEAVAWYRDVLGLKHLYTYGDLAFFDLGGTRLFLSHHEDGNHAGESTIYFRVPDIKSAYEELRKRGVNFKGAPHMIFRHPNGMEEWMAFFEDPEGRLLAIMSQVMATGSPDR